MAFSADKSKLVGGPANVELGGTSIGHTQGGVTATITPQNRGRVVDQYGSSWVDVIHTGDEVRISVPITQWEIAKLKELYNPGLDGTTYLGIGRSAGFIYTTKLLEVIPLLTADAAKKLTFFRATPIGQFAVGHNNDNDRVMQVDFAALVDPTKTDGFLIGKLFLS